MNQSSLFLFDDSTVWDPKVRLRLSIPEDQLNILHTLPEWNKIQDSSIRLEKDSLIENSQPQHSFSASEIKERIRKQNIELFDKHQQHRRSILKTCKIYKTKFTRSISLLDIDKTNISVFNSNTFLRRASSLSSVLLNFSQINSTKELNSDSCSPKTHSSLHNSKELFNFPVIDCTKKVSLLELKQSKNSFDNREITSEVMEVVPQLPVSNSTNMGKVVGIETDFRALEEKVCSLPKCNDESPCNNQNVTSVEGLVKPDTSSLSEVKKSTESHVSISCENNNSDTSNQKETVLVSTDKNAESSQLHEDERKCGDDKDVEVPCKTVLITNDICSKENITINLNTEKSNESFVSTSYKTDPLYTVKEKVSIDASSVVVENIDTNSCVQKFNEIPKEGIKPIEATTKGQSCKENLQSNGKDVFESCNKINCEKMDTSKNIADNSVKLEMPITGKRKSDSKPRKSKKLKNEERQDNIKVRSIKKVGEICYCAEDVKDMLDIIKQFL